MVGGQPGVTELQVVDVTLGDRDKANALVRTPAEEHPDQPVIESPALLRADGDPVALVLRLPMGDRATIRQAMRSYPMDTTVRSAGVRNRSRVFGYGARQVMMQRNACRACSGADDAPVAHAAICGMAPRLAALYAAQLPDLAARELDTAGAVLPEWRIAETQWTSGVLNRNSALPYHYDGNNLEPVWSAMVVARRAVRGGLLHIPELGVHLACRDGEVVFFPGWRFVHGVTPQHVLAKDGYRFSAVFYAVRNMKECLPYDEELARGRADRTEREGDLRPASERIPDRPASEAGKRRGPLPQDWRRRPDRKDPGW